MKKNSIQSGWLRNWIRDLHGYFGLFISPFVLLYAFTAILYNHSWKINNAARDVKVEKRTASVSVPAADLDSLIQAKQIMRQLNVSGEVLLTRYLPGQNLLAITVMKPGKRVNINVNTKSQIAEIEQRRTGIWAALNYLHRSPGPHNVKNRANWFYTKIWAFLADATVYLFFLISVSGIYMWYILKSERRIGLILLGAGCLSFFLIILVIVH